MAWSLDVTPQMKFKIFLNHVFQFWNFCGILLLQEIWKTYFSPLPDSISSFPCHPNSAPFDPVSFYFLILRKHLPPFQPLPSSGFADSPQFSLLSWEIPPNLQCLFWAAKLSLPLLGDRSSISHVNSHINVRWLLPDICTPITAAQRVRRERLGA